MDVLNFLQNGNVRPNPDYNPKTKKGKFQSPTLVDYNPGGSISDQARHNIARIAAPNLYSFNTDDVNKYVEYNTYLNPFDTQEELNRERADNQGWIEQTGRAVSQGVVNEVLIGSALGFSNLIDILTNGVKYAATGEWDTDFTNPVSKSLEDVQNDIRDAWEIYQRNPGEAFDITDFGWWANNSVSVLSTASMLLPTMGVTKGLSMVGRGIRAASAAGKGGKLIQGLNKVGNMASAENIAMKLADNFSNKFAAFKDTGKLTDQLRLSREITQNAVLSRTMENYLEARETYNEIQQTALTRLQNMTPEDRTEFFSYNPNLQGKSDKEIAEYIAGESANETFINDYAMLLMDVVQFKGLSDIYKGTHKASNASLALATKKQKDKLLNKVLPESASLRDKIANSDLAFKARYIVTHPTEGLFAIEWSEGIEEGYQGIQVEKGKEVAEKIFNPSFTPRDIESYLRDPHIYEQAFWGVLGAVAFGGLGKGLRWASNKLENVEGLINDKNEIAIRKLSDQLQRKKGIEGWADKTQSFINDMNLINDGYNPLKPIMNEDGSAKTDENGKIIYEEITDKNNVNLLKNKILNDYLTEVGFNAMERGNFDIFTAFLTDPEIAKYIQDQTQRDNDTKFEVNMLQRLQSVSDKYTLNMFNIRNSIHVKNPYVANLMVRDMTRAQLQIDDNNTDIASTTDQIEDLLLTDLNDYTQFEENAIIDLMNQKLTELNKHEQTYNKLLADKKISGAAYNDYIQAINEHRRNIYEYLNSRISSLSLFNNFGELFSALPKDYDSNQLSTFINNVTREFNIFKSQIQPSTAIPSKAVIDLMAKRSILEFDNFAINNQIPKSTAQLQKAYDETAIRVDKLVIDRYNKAVDNVVKWIEKQDNLEEARDKLYTNQVPELEDTLRILKIGHVDTQQFWRNINIALQSEQNVRDKQEKDNATVVINDEQQNEERATEIHNQMEESVPEQDDISTGKRKETESTVPTITTESLIPTEIEQDEDKDLEIIVDKENEIIDDYDPEIPMSAKDYYGDDFSEDIGDIDEVATNESLNEWARTKTLAIAVVRDEILGNSDKFKNINLNDRNTKEYQQLIEYLATKIIEETGININDAKELAEYGISINKFFIERKSNNPNIGDLAKAILADLKITGRYSAIQSIEAVQDAKDRLDTVKIFLEAYATERKLRPSKKGITINIIKLFDYILNDRTDITVEQGVDLFTNLYKFIINNQDRLGYRFIGIKELQKAYRDPNYIREQLAAIKNRYEYNARYQHVTASSDHRAPQIIRESSPETPVKVTYDPYGDNADRNIRFWINDVEVGYLAPVGVNETHTTYWSLANSGFLYKVTKTINEKGNPVYTFDNFDKLFKAILLDIDNNKELHDIIFNHIINEETAEILLNHPIIKELLRKDEHKYADISFPKSFNEIKDIKQRRLEQAKYIQRNILDVTNFNINAETEEEKYMSYQKYREKVFDNYTMTYNLMTAREATVKFKNAWQGPINYNTEGIEYDCNTRGFNAKDNPIIGVLSPTTMIAEGIDTPFDNAVGFRKNIMGFMVRDAQNGPAVARITSFKKIADNEKIRQLFDKTITDLINKYITDRNYSFEQFRDNLKELLGGNKYAGKSLFNGLAVYSSGDYFSIGTPNTDATRGKFLFTVSKYKKGTKEESRIIWFNKNGITKNNRALTSDNIKRNINNVLDIIHDNLKFNGTHFTLKNVNKTNVQNTRYMYIDNNGKFVVELGGEKMIYDSFTDFALKENICRTNQEISETGGYFDDTWDIKSLFVDVNTINYSSPVKGEDYAAKYKILEDLKGLSATTPITADEILKAGNVSQEYIDFFNSIRAAGINLIPENIFYDAKGGGLTRFSNKLNKIYITPSYIRNAKSDITVLTPIIHEQIHAQFSKLDKTTREKILNDLTEIYYDTIKYLEKDINNSNKEIANVAKTIYDWINTNNFSPNDYGYNLPKASRRKYEAMDETDRIQWFMEEWLVETMTNPAILYYLNNTEYKEANVETTGSKSLLQRLLEILLQMFNKLGRFKNKLPKINNNTILATQFQILDGNYVKKETTQETINETPISVEEKQTEQPIETPIVKQDDIELKDNEQIPEAPIDTIIEDNDFSFGAEDFEDMGLTDNNENFNFYDETRYSVIPSIESTINDENNNLDEKINRFADNPVTNPANITFVNNMDEFLNQFDVVDRENIKKALEDGTFTWVCV